jgi:hypothetical protein
LLREVNCCGRESEFWLAYVSFDELKVLGCAICEACGSIDAVSSAVQPRRLHEQDKTAIFPCQTFQQAICYKTGKPGDEECLPIRH